MAYIVCLLLLILFAILVSINIPYDPCNVLNVCQILCSVAIHQLHNTGPNLLWVSHRAFCYKSFSTVIIFSRKLILRKLILSSALLCPATLYFHPIFLSSCQVLPTSKHDILYVSQMAFIMRHAGADSSILKSINGTVRSLLDMKERKWSLCCLKSLTEKRSTLLFFFWLSL